MMYRRIYIFFLTYLLATGYAQTMIWLWFFNHGVSYFGMLFAALCNFSFGIPIYYLLEGKVISSRKSIPLGIFASAVAVLVAFNMIHPWHAYVACGLFAFANVFFWTLYNSMHFTYGKEGMQGYKSGLYFLLFPLTAAVTAPLSGLIVGRFGYDALFITGLCAYIIPFLLSFSLPVFDFKFTTKRAASLIENKTMLFFQGYNGILGMTLIPIFTLFFIREPIYLGNFFGYLALLSASVAFVNSHISDRRKDRSLFFYFFSTLNALSYMFIFFLNSLLGWQVFTGLNKVTSSLASPFDIALTVDSARLSINETMLGREIYLNLGRVVALVLGLMILWFTHSFFYIFFVNGFIAMLYPVVAYFKRVYLVN